MEKKERMTFYKLSKSSTVFYDSSSGLKVLQKVPGKVPSNKITKNIRNAVKGGHIQEINETEYNDLMNKLPKETLEGLKKEGSKPQSFTTESRDDKKEKGKKVKDEDEEDEDEEEDEDDGTADEGREELEEQLESLGLSKKKTKEAKKLDDEALKKFIEDNS